jgi:signal transduction histidine kinase
MPPEPQIAQSTASLAVAGAAGHVLVVEDQLYDRELLVRVLRSDGHRVTEATSGAGGLEELDRARPDVVLCDVVMPEMNGLDFCRAVKSRPGAEFVPVLLVTGRADREDLLAGFEAGADDYIAKPIEPRELKARVRTMVRIHQLHTQLVEQSQKLAEANRDMEEFLHAVSHDLRAPVISLTGLAAKLAREHAARLGDDGRLLVERLQTSAGSMSALVNHLVEFARMGNAPYRPRSINLRLLIEQACTNLSSQIEKAHARIEIQRDWPTLAVDPVSICQVFQNLIGNAVKFMGPQVGPHVEVGCRAENPAGDWEIFVRDNGVGIPPDKHQEIFRLFARLGHVESDGLGVGLSTTEKIVKRHGGRIWVESAQGSGATFHFTLPRLLNPEL